MNQQKGFTLVEMLVVIAVIGILSATALTALGPARSKAKDARIISAMQQIRVTAETLYDGDYDAVTINQPDIDRLIRDIKGNGGRDLGLSKDNDNSSQAYEVHVTLNKGTKYCIDSGGYSAELDNGQNPAGSGQCIQAR